MYDKDLILLKQKIAEAVIVSRQFVTDLHLTSHVVGQMPLALHFVKVFFVAVLCTSPFVNSLWTTHMNWNSRPRVACWRNLCSRLCRHMTCGDVCEACPHVYIHITMVTIQFLHSLPR